MNGYIEAFVHIAIWIILVCGAVALAAWSVSVLWDKLKERSDAWEQSLVNRMGSAEWEIRQFKNTLDCFVNNTKRPASQDELAVLADTQKSHYTRLQQMEADIEHLREYPKTYNRLTEQLHAVMNGIDRRQECIKRQLEDLLVTINLTPEKLAKNAEAVRQADKKMAEDAEVLHQADHLQVPAPQTAGHFGIDWAEEHRRMCDARSARTGGSNSGAPDGGLPAPK